MGVTVLMSWTMIIRGTYTEERNMNEGPFRFHDRATFKDPSALLRHVDIDPKTGRDRFGNRVITSPELAYLDRENRSTKAAMLVSAEGERFLKSNPGILKELDRGLQEMMDKRKQGKSSKGVSIELDQHRRLTHVGNGAQSEVFKLETSSGDYVIKIHVNRSQLQQPYINEMLQIQSLAAEEKEALSAVNIDFPQYLFASGQVMCAEYAPGPAEFSEDFTPVYYAATVIAEDFISQQKMNGNELWKNIHIDKIQRIGNVASDYGIPASNFRRRLDGSLVWIDPVAYYEGEPSIPDGLYPFLSQREIDLLEPLTVDEMQKNYLAAEQEVMKLIEEVENYPEGDDAKWVDNAHRVFRELGIKPHESPDYLSVDYMAAKKKILKKYGIRWVLAIGDI